MTVEGATRVLGCLFLLGSLGVAGANGQSLAEEARKQKERREKAGSPTSTSPSFSNEDLQKQGGSSESQKESSKPGEPRSSSTKTTGDHDEAWWRAQAQERRDAIVEAEAEVKRYEGLLEEARTGIRQPLPSDATRQVPRRIVTDAERRLAEAALAASRLQLAEAKKAMDDLEDEARRKQILPGWLR